MSASSNSKPSRDLRGSVEDDASHAATSGRLDCFASLLSMLDVVDYVYELLV
jgi:hypothetical protein